MRDWLEPAAIWGSVAAVLVGFLLIMWIAVLRSEKRDRELCAKICAPAVSIFSAERGCFCEGSACRRF